MPAIYQNHNDGLENTYLYKTLQTWFGQLDTLDGIALEDTTWKLNEGSDNQIITLDFSLFEKEHLQFKEYLEVKHNGECITITLSDVAKMIWLSIVKGRPARRQLSLGVFNFLSILFAFLKSTNSVAINSTNLIEFYGFCLTQNVTETGIEKRLSAPAYTARFSPIPLHKLKKHLQHFGIYEITEHISIKKSFFALNEACQSVMDTTLADYKDGGSFNYLGLDIGKHYIDHCNNLFEAHSAFIIAIRQTEKKWTAFQTERSENKISGSASLTILGYILSGEDFYKLPYNVLSVSEKKRSFAEKLIHRLFRKYYSLAQRKTVPFQVDTVNRIASACQLSERYDTQEFIRSLLFVDVFGEWGKSKDEIYEEYRACAEKGHEPLIPSLIDIKRCIKEELSRLYIKLPNHVEGMRTFFKKYVAGLPTALIDHQSNGLAYFHTMSTMIEDAGVTCLLGLTGWRASEYGFPLSSIQISLNHDSLDNQYTPWRFHVHWKVPKTSGSTPLFREITLGSYILIAQLAALNGADYQKPALYKVSTEGQMNHSENTIKKAVNTCWADFIKNYVIFSDIDRYHKLTENLDVLDETEIKELNHLKSQYQFESSTLIEISRIKDQLNNDFPRVELCEKQGRGLTFGDNLRRFAEGIASLEITQLLDKFLSEETIAKLKSGDFALDKAGVRFVRSEFLDGTPHPTSHAFRHIWAEAVLRRYRGDIGKFIRANFKHIDERFFMAYLRGKEMKIIHQVASRDVINSVVRQQLNSLNDKYREYAGGFDRFLSKAVNITKIYSHEDLTELADKISNERVLSIKPNPWTDCLLKAGTNNLAKCSVDGVPNRQNASPRLCLGCINGNIAEGNFNGIVVYLQQDVAACRNNQLPWFIKQQHVQVVIIALKRVKELSRNSTNEKHYKFIRHLEESLRLALDNMGDEL